MADKEKKPRKKKTTAVLHKKDHDFFEPYCLTEPGDECEPDWFGDPMDDPEDDMTCPDCVCMGGELDPKTAKKYKGE